MLRLPRQGMAATVVFGLLAGTLRAQCPDGTPLPCGQARERTPPPNSVAVLYLDNLSRDSADAFLADGLTEEIIIRLSQVQRIAVKSRFEVQRFRGRSAMDAAALGRALDAAYLVTGSVQRAGDRVRLRVELIRAATRALVWGDAFDKASSDLLTIEADIGREVATRVTGQLLPGELTLLARPVTSDPIAYDEYLRGLHTLHGVGDESAQLRAIALFDRAIARDSGFASAFAAKALAWSDLADGFVSPREGYAKSREAASQALARDSSQALAYAMLSTTVLSLDLNGPAAEALARRAVALDPHGGEPYAALSAVLFAEGRMPEAVEEARLAWQNDSLSPDIGFWYSGALVYSGQLDSAAAFVPRYRSAVSAADADPIEGLVLAAQGRLSEAEHLLGWRYYGGLVAGWYVRALLARGDTVAARAVVDSMLAARTAGYYNALPLARVYAELGDVDRGMVWLRRAFEERTAWLNTVRRDPELALLRADPRYAALDAQLRF